MLSEYPEMFQQKDVRARKQYRCESCQQDILPGSRYRLSTGLWDGEFGSIRQHMHCWELMELVMQDFDGPDPLCFQDVYEVARDMEILDPWWPGATKNQHGYME